MSHTPTSEDNDEMEPPTMSYTPTSKYNDEMETQL